jgi:integrase
MSAQWSLLGVKRTKQELFGPLVSALPGISDLDLLGEGEGIAVLAQLSAIMAWFASRDENYTSPIVKGMRRNTNAKPRDRVLSDAELRLVWEACADFGMFGRFIKLLVLSAQRRDKVATMRWDDITDGV